MPITILSGYLKSRIASPSLKNSGFDTTSNNFLFTLELIIFSILSPVATGIVDLVIIILNFFMYFLIFLTTLKTYFKFTKLLFFTVGVPTQINIISEYVTAFFKFVVKINLLSL